MKLKHILIASLAVCAFASCSKDDNGTTTPEIPQIPVDASVSFMAVPDNVLSRSAALKDDATAGATEEGKSNENIITKLGVYIFNANGTLAGSKFVKEENGLTTIEHVRIKIVPGKDGITSSEQFQAVFVANVDSLSVSTLAQLKAMNLGVSIAGEKGLEKGLLPMVNKKDITFSGLKVLNGGTTKYENWIDNGGNSIIASGGNDADLKKPSDYTQPIELERLVARVQVESIAVAFVGDKEDEGKYSENAQFTLKTLSLVNVANGTTISGVLPAGVDYVKGYKSAAYVEADKWIDPKSSVVEYLRKGDYGIVLDNDVKTPSTASRLFADTDKDKFRKYIFTNPADGAYKTALLISGMFTRDKTKDPNGTERHYRVYLNSTFMIDGSNAFVQRNTIYKLNITIDGEGSGNEDHIETTAGVNVSIVSGSWKTITQEEDIKN